MCLANTLRYWIGNMSGNWNIFCSPYAVHWMLFLLLPLLWQLRWQEISEAKGQQKLQMLRFYYCSVLLHGSCLVWLT